MEIDDDQLELLVKPISSMVTHTQPASLLPPLSAYNNEEIAIGKQESEGQVSTEMTSNVAEIGTKDEQYLAESSREYAEDDAHIPWDNFNRAWEERQRMPDTEADSKA